MKQKISILILFFMISMSCDINKDIIEELCPEPPTGTIDSSRLNLCVFNTEGLELFNAITLIKDNEEFLLDASSFTKEVFSAW